MIHLSSDKQPRSFSSLERLESRIAPAAGLTIPDGKTAIWTDIDGDRVTLKATKSIFEPNGSQFTFLADSAGDIGAQLALLDLHSLAASNSGVGLTFTARRDTVGHHGDGVVNVGRIDATGLDLGDLKISGDLASIDAGDQTLTTAAIKSITAASAGQFGTDTQGAMLQGAAPHIDWQFIGKIGNVTVKGDFYVAMNAADTDGVDDNNDLISMGNITIGGDLVGGDETLSGYMGFGSGQIFSEGSIGIIKIGGDVVGSSSHYSGAISTFDGPVKSLSVGGSFIGGSTEFTGIIQVGSLGSVTIGGSLLGGTDSDTGEILVYGALGNVTISHSIIGGNTPRDGDGNIPLDSDMNPIFITRSGVIHGETSIGKVTINGDLQTGQGNHSGAIELIGSGKIAAITIKNSFLGNSLVSDNNDTYRVSNGINSGGQLGPITIGAIVGGDPLAPLDIIAQGKASPANAAAALAIASVTVTRGAQNVEILAGFTDPFTATNPDVIIGAIKVGLSFSGSISAGVLAGTKGYGDTGGALTAAATGFTNGAILSQITSLTVGTYVVGNPWHDIGFVNGVTAQQIGSVKIGGVALEFVKNSATAPLDTFILGQTHEFLLTEVA